MSLCACVSLCARRCGACVMVAAASTRCCPRKSSRTALRSCSSCTPATRRVFLTSAGLPVCLYVFSGCLNLFMCRASLTPAGSFATWMHTYMYAHASFSTCLRSLLQPGPLSVRLSRALYYHLRFSCSFALQSRPYVYVCTCVLAWCADMRTGTQTTRG